MAKRSSDDHIPTFGELEAEHDKRREYIAKHIPPMFEVKYELLKAGWEGVRVDKIGGMSEASAAEVVARDWRSLGIPVKIIATKKIHGLITLDENGNQISET